MTDTAAPAQGARQGVIQRVLSAIAPKGVDVPILTRLFKEYWRRFALRYILAMLLMGVIAASTALSAWMMRDVINEVFIARNMQMTVFICVAIVVIYGARGLATYGQEIMLAAIGNRIVAEVQKKLFNAFLMQDVAFFQRMNSSDLVTRVTFNAQAANQALQALTQSVGRDLFTLVGLMAVMISQDPLLTGIVLLTAPILLFGVSGLLRQVRKLFTKEMMSISAVISTVQEAAHGIRVIKTFRLEDALRARMDGAVRSVEKLMNRMISVQAATAPLVDVMGGIAVAAVIAYGGWRVAVEGATPGQFFAFIAALLMASDPIRKLTRLNVTLATASVGVKMMYDLIDAVPQVKDPPGCKPLAVRGGTVTLKNVTFGYDPEKPVLHDLSLTAPAGKTTALVGLSGSGKSTIFNLVLRFWQPQSGAVEIDGQDLATVSAESIYSSVAMVSQDVFLFGGTIRDNILRGRPDATEEELFEAARAAAAHDFIQALPNGYETSVGEFGGMLSGGQRQRISIARAFLKDASILLLDEPTSALDAESDAAIQGALARLMKGRTTMIIAHRLATVASADVIHIIEKGRVVESGAHADLMRKDGVYARLHAMQFAVL